MKLAVIGSGISGLVAAHLLCDDHQITLFEAGNYIGGHTNTIDVELDGEKQAVDTGFIVFNEMNYPNFSKLMNQLGVESQPTDMSFSVRCDSADLEYNGTSLNKLFIQRSNLLRPSFLKMVRDILRFGKTAPAIVSSAPDTLTVEQYVKDERFSDSFLNYYLVPLGASLWSCPAESFLKFPIRFVVEFLHNHKMLQVNGRPIWRVIKGGSKNYIPKLTQKYADQIRLNTPVKAVRRFADHVELTLGNDERVSFDQVIFACHADTSLRILSDPSDVEKQLMQAFPYQKNQAILHTDTSVLPNRQKAWASWNYRINARSSDVATVTYNMNILQRLTSKNTFCVTLDSEEGIAASKIIKKIEYHHPIYTASRSAAWARHSEVISSNRTSFCGAYWGYGFHEDGVRSALAVAKAFGRVL